MILATAATTRADAVSREIGRAESCIQKGDYVGAIKHLDWVLEQHPDNAQALMWRGYTRLQQRDLGPSLADFDRANRLQPDTPTIVLGRLQVFEALNDWGRLRAEIEPVIQAHPRDGRLHDLRGNAWMFQNEWARARADFDQAIALRGNRPDTFGRRGVCLLALHEPAAALADLDRAIPAEPMFPEDRFGRVAALVMLRRYDEAIKDLDSLATGPARAVVLHLRGAARLSGGDAPGALAD